MVDTSIFKKNPVSSSPLRGGGKVYSIHSEIPKGSNHAWRISWTVPEVDGRMDYDTAYITITGGAKREEFYRYSTEGNTQLRNLPTGLKDRIVSDYNSLTADEATYEETTEQTGEMSVETVRTEKVRGFTISMTLTTNSLDMRASGQSFYTVSSTEGQSRSFIMTQEEAEEIFSSYVSSANGLVGGSEVFDYEGVKITFQDTNHKDGEDGKNKDGITYDLIMVEGRGIEERFTPPHELIFRDMYGLVEFGTLTMNTETDMDILKTYIDARLTQREDPNYVEPTGILPVYSWGWYNSNNDSMYCPFSTVKLVEVYTVSNTDGRILGITDSDFLADSGGVKLVVKEGYRVRLKMMTQNRGYFEDNIPNLDEVSVSGLESYDLGEADAFNQSTNYGDTEKVSIDLFGGDSVEIDIDSEVAGISRFSIRKNGTQVVKGAPQEINDETFLAVIEVEKDTTDSTTYSPGSGLPGDAGQDKETSTETGNVLALVVGGVLILGVLYMIFSFRGGEE